MCNTEKLHRKIRGGILLTEFRFSMEYIGENTVGYAHMMSGGGGLTETKNKDTGKGMLKLIITEDKHGLLWGYLVKTKNTGCGFKGGIT